MDDSHRRGSRREQIPPRAAPPGHDLPERRSRRRVVDERISRRQFVERVLGLGLTAATAGGLAAACGGRQPARRAASPSPGTVTDPLKPSAIKVFAWRNSLAPDVLRGFTRQTGIAVDMSFMEGDPILTMLRAGESGWDVIVASDYIVEPLREKQLAQPLDMSLLPSFANVSPLFDAPAYDDPGLHGGQRFSVPLSWGTAGYATRTDKVVGPTTSSWSALWDPAYSGDIVMLNDEREVLAAALLLLGYSPNTTVQSEIDAATRKLLEQKPLVNKYDSVGSARSIVTAMPFTQCWNSDALRAIEKLGGDVTAQSVVRYVLPDEGFSLWADTLVIPKGVRSPYGAHLFMNYLLDPVVMANTADHALYLPPGLETAGPYCDPLLMSFAPTTGDLDRGRFLLYSDTVSRAYTDAWAKVKSAGYGD